MNLDKEFTEPNIILCYLTEEHDENIVLSSLKKQFPNNKRIKVKQRTLSGFCRNCWGLVLGNRSSV